MSSALKTFKTRHQFYLPDDLSVKLDALTDSRTGFDDSIGRTYIHRRLAIAGGRRQLPLPMMTQKSRSKDWSYKTWRCANFQPSGLFTTVSRMRPVTTSLGAIGVPPALMFKKE
ncbi:hypothetical protein TomMM35A_16750 [Sphingobium sp. TomMM35A]